MSAKHTHDLLFTSPDPNGCSPGWPHGSTLLWDLTAVSRPAHGGRSCRFAHQRVSRPPSRSSGVALSSSRYANNPASEVTADPRNQATVKIEPNNIQFCFTSRVFQEFPQSDDIKQPISESARELLTHCVIRRMRAYGKLPIGEKLEKPPFQGRGDGRKFSSPRNPSAEAAHLCYN